MLVEDRSIRAALAGALVLSPALTGNDAPAQAKKITLPALRDTVHHGALDWAAAVDEDSSGRINPQFYPATRRSRAGSSARSRRRRFRRSFLSASTRDSR